MSVDAKLESLLDLVITDLVDDRERYLDADGTLWEPIGAAGAKRNEHWTIARLHEARCLSRQLVDENPFAANAIENRISFLIGAGHAYRVDPRPGVDRTDPSLTAVSQFLEEFDELNRWQQRQIERQRRFDRDGESFDRLFTDDESRSPTRTATPRSTTKRPGRRSVTASMAQARSSTSPPVANTNSQRSACRPPAWSKSSGRSFARSPPG